MMRRTGTSHMFQRLLVTLLLVLPVMKASAQASPEAVYTVTLTAVAAVDEPDVVAAQIAGASGGTVESVVDGTVTMRLSPSRVRVVAADPRVQSVAARTDGAVPGRIATAAETMTWSTGVAYDYDHAGNVRQIGTDAFVYDTVGRLVQSHTNGTPRNYEYDAFGNRTKCRQSEGTSDEGDCQWGYTVDPATNQLNNVGYDAAGNVTTMGTHTYAYDALNMQTRDVSGSLAREYIYTADDERIAIYDVGYGWRWTVRETSGKVLREFTSANGPNGALGTANWQWTKDHVWRGGLLLASRQEEGNSVTTYHYHLDHLGTPRRITDDADRIVGVHDYFPFGTEKSGGQNEPSLSLMKFTGHERDIVGYESWDTLDYMHARFGNPTLGRFSSVDPIYSTNPRFPQSWNKYLYGLNNPLRFVDPTGMYVSNCMGGDEACEREAAAFEAARQEQLASTDEALRNAAAAYGDPGVENGVSVSFVTAQSLGKANADVTAQLITGEQASAKFDVRFKIGMSSQDLKNAVVHEGEHIRNGMGYVEALRRGTYDPTLNLTLYQTEMNAYMVSWAFARTSNSVLNYNGMQIKGMMPREQLKREIDRFLRKPPYSLTPERTRCQFMPCD